MIEFIKSNQINKNPSWVIIDSRITIGRILKLGERFVFEDIGTFPSGNDYIEIGHKLNELNGVSDGST